MEDKNKFTITKKVAKHGNQAIIVIPKILEERLKPGTIVKIDIDVLQEMVEKSQIKSKVVGEER